MRSMFLGGCQVAPILFSGYSRYLSTARNTESRIDRISLATFGAERTFLVGKVSFHFSHRFVDLFSGGLQGFLEFPSGGLQGSCDRITYVRRWLLCCSSAFRAEARGILKFRSTLRAEWHHTTSGIVTVCVEERMP